MKPHDNPETQDLESAATDTSAPLHEATGHLVRRLAALPPPSEVEVRDTEPLPERPGL